jgi:hypothetical protein
MMGSEQESPGWSKRRLALFVTLILVVQIGLIFWLSDRRVPTVRTPRFAPVLRMVGDSADDQSTNSLLRELSALQDPTMFALPRNETFAGLAWLSVPKIVNPSLEWSEDPMWELTNAATPASQLGAAFSRFIETNVVKSWHVEALPEPALIMPTVEPDPRLNAPSRVQLFCTDPQVQLLTPLPLPAWPPRSNGPNDFELLTNSVVAVTYGPDGKTFSTALLSGSGLPAADDFAMNQARQARFSLGNTGTRDPSKEVGGLGWATLVFEWSTTNGPAPN